MGRRGWILGAVLAACGLIGLCSVGCVGGVLLLSGRFGACAPGRPGGITLADLAGRYVSAAGGQLVLDASGTLTARGIVTDFGNQPLVLSGPGDWSLLPHDDGFGDIHLGFDDAHFSTYLDISGTRSKPWLYWYIGDPDSCDIQRFDRG